MDMTAVEIYIYYMLTLLAILAFCKISCPES